jgi:glycosyltransferase involved in cell wall biosynthesis
VLTRANVGGPARQVFDLWGAHQELGVRTLLLIGSTGAGEGELARVARRRGTEVPIPTLSLEEAGSLGPDAEGIVVIPELRRGVNPLTDLRAERGIAKLTASFAPDVVHTHMSKAGFVGRRVAHRFPVPVTAHTFHGHVLRDYFGPARSLLFRLAERRLAAKTDLLFAVSPSCAAELAELGVAARERLRVLPPGLDLTRHRTADRAAARAALGLAADEAAVGFVGRFVPVKRPELFLKTVVRIAAGLGRPVAAVCVGQGPKSASLARRAARVAQPGLRVLLPGTREDLAALLPALDLLLFTSRREGCPLAGVEAFACGVPVAGIDVPGVHDLLAEWGRGGLSPEQAGADGLASLAVEMLSEPERTASWVAASREAAERFQVEALAGALLAAYREALAGKESGGA